MPEIPSASPRTPPEHQQENTHPLLLDRIPLLEFFTRMSNLRDRKKEGMNGVESIDVYGDPAEARHCLVHIRQIHFNPKDKRTSPSEHVEHGTDVGQMVQRSQAAIYTILQELHREFGKLPLYQEGMLPRAPDVTAESRKQQRRNLRSAQRDLQYMDTVRVSLSRLRPSIPERLAWLKEHVDSSLRSAVQSENMLEDNVRTVQNKRVVELAPGYAAEVNMADIRPGEDEAVIQKLDACTVRMEDLEKDRPWSSFQEHEYKQLQFVEEDLKMRQREDALLSIIASSNTSVGVSPFGGDHDFRRAVKEWNEKPEHANKKFILIEITPKYYKKDTPKGRR